MEQDNLPKITIMYRKFHELPIKTRLDILHYLCQNKLDTEAPEFIQEVANIQTMKRARGNSSANQVKRKERGRPPKKQF